MRGEELLLSQESPWVRLVGWTSFEPPPETGFTTDADGGQALAEFAGRACYETWDKPNPATATNATFLRHLLDVGHLAVFEHGHATLYITGLSRSAAQELVRHRHLSFSQLSPRYDPGPDGAVIEPSVIADDPQLHARFTQAVAASHAAYRELLAGLEGDSGHTPGAAPHRRRARQAARTVLPQATETRLVVTGNYRAWRHLVAARATEHADVELRALAVACLRRLRQAAPHVFADFVISRSSDGGEIAASPLTWES